MPPKTPKAPKTGRVTPIGEAPKSGSITQIVGAKLITGENVIGMRTKSGIDHAMIIIAQPYEDEERKNNLRVILVPYIIPLFVKRPEVPDVADKHIMGIYDIPAQLADHYLEKQAGMTLAEKE